VKESDRAVGQVRSELCARLTEELARYIACRPSRSRGNDLEAHGPSQTRVTLTYDWSAVGPEVREYMQFPVFAPDHLDSSLQHLSDLVAQV
jgi:hypothetical protein